MRCGRVVLCLLLFCCRGAAQEVAGNQPSDKQAAVVTHLPKDEIQVTTDYHGERLLIYGTVSPDCDVVVKLSSPRVPVTYARKDRVGIFWFTVGKITFQNVPWMFKIKSTRPLDEILSVREQIHRRLGKQGLISSIQCPDPESSSFLIEEMIQNRISDQLYSFREGEIRRVKGNMFETSFFWPPKAPPGTYHVDTFAVRAGKVVSFESELVKVEKVGVEAWVSKLAIEHGLLYGVVAVVVAMACGLIVGLVFRGMGPGR